MTTFVIFWAILGVATLALALYRKFVTMREDDYVHLSAGEERLIPQQVATFKKIGAIDRWARQEVVRWTRTKACTVTE